MALPTTPSPNDGSKIGSLHWADILVIVVYLALVIAVGIWSSCRNRGSVGGYFLAGRSMHWIPVGASLFASNIGSGHFIGLAGSGASNGIAIASFELNAIFILLLLGWVFIPVYMASGVSTMPEYIKKRFGGQRIRIYLAVLALLLYIFTKISADLYAGAVFLKAAFNIDIYFSAVILLILSALFTIAGGLTAVIWTDFIQTVIMVIGATILAVLSFIEVGGYEAAIRKFHTALPNTTIVDQGAGYRYQNCGHIRDDYMKLMRSAEDPQLPWPGVVFGVTISAVWYWCTDQVIVQRALAARSLSHAKAGTILAGYLKFLPLYIMVFPGMISRIKFKDTVGCADPDICERFCGSRSGCTNYAYPKLVIDIMPIALRGLMVAVMMSALVSSLTSIFNSSSTIFTMDIWRKFRTLSSDVELMIVGRICVLVLVIIGIVWMPIVENMAELFHYIQAVTSYLAPPICAVYVLAVMWKRVTEKAVFWSLMIGLVVGCVRFIWEFSYGIPPPCGEGDNDYRHPVIKRVVYLHFGIMLFGIVFISTVIISLFTKRIDDIHQVGLTFWTRFDTDENIELSVMEGEGSQEKLGKPDSRSTSRASSQIIEQPKPVPWWKTALYWICGIEKMKKPSKQTDCERQQRKEQLSKMYESTWWQRGLNINAVILFIVGVAFWVYYSI